MEKRGEIMSGWRRNLDEGGSGKVEEREINRWRKILRDGKTKWMGGGGVRIRSIKEGE